MNGKYPSNTVAYLESSGNEQVPFRIVLRDGNGTREYVRTGLSIKSEKDSLHLVRKTNGGLRVRIETLGTCQTRGCARRMFYFEQIDNARKIAVNLGVPFADSAKYRDPTLNL